MTAPCVLLIDDDAAIAEMMTSVLTEDGYTVVSAARPQDAVRLLVMHGPDGFRLIISDALGPWSADPFIWLDELHQHAVAPVVVSSAHPESLFTGWRARGFAGFLAKPFDIDALTTLVGSLCGAPRARPWHQGATISPSNTVEIV